MEKPLFTFEFPYQQDKAATLYGEESIKPVKEEFVQSHSRQEVLPSNLKELFLKSHLREQLLQSQTKEETEVVAKGDVQKPIIIDLDTYEDGEESSDTSMALVTVPDPPQQNLYNNANLAIVRVDNTETRGVASLAGVRIEQQEGRIGFNPPLTSALVAQCQSPGNGQVAPLTPPGAGVWDGPPRWGTSTVGILTVQCARCLKWRVVPSREKYEAIREHVLETPWVCENALQWRSDAHCDLPPDLNQDSQMLWAIDKPNLPSSPPGWQRKVVVRRDCSSRFADVYYTAPDGKSLRSMVEVARYLEENPGSVPEGTKIGQFSYTSPRPLPGLWTARKRTRMRSAITVSSSTGEGKKARVPQPLAKQLAQRLLHGTTPPSLPIAPPPPSPSAPSFQLPVGASIPGPVMPQLAQSLAVQAPTHPPAPNFINPPSLSSFPSSLPPIRSPFPFPPSGVGRPSQTSHQVPLFSPGGPMATFMAGRCDSTPSMAAAGSKKQQQKSRLGGIFSTSQTMDLAGTLPLREPNSQTMNLAGALPLREPSGV